MGPLIDRYEIQGVVRAEPLGRLLLVREPDLDRCFYLKELCPPGTLTAEEGGRLRAAFRAEMAGLARSGDPRLLRPLHHGVTSTGEPFLVFESPEESGAAPLCAAAASWRTDEALRSCGELAEALGSLADAGILPPAFEPSTAFLTPAGEVRYLHPHFGHLATAAGLPPGFFAHDPQWTAAEVLLGKPPSPASLTFSAACWIHGTLAGSGQSPAAAMLRGEALAPLWSMNPSVPTPVDDVLRGALAPDASARTAHPALLAAGLRNAGSSAADRTLAEPAAGEPTVTWRPEPEPPSPFAAYLRWGLILAVLAGALGWIAGQVLSPR
jgi:hypothetical protein